MLDPGGMAVDNENRFLYVADAAQDMVLVYDADTTQAHAQNRHPRQAAHADVARRFCEFPQTWQWTATDNLYVSDTFNDRIEVFDADGKFIRTFGKAGDGPGYFARPKGIAIDGDGHVWVADAVQDRVQVFTPEGELLIWMGKHGRLPGQFQSLARLYHR